MLSNVRVAQPSHSRSDADGALKLLNCGDAGDLRLPIAKTDLSDHIHALEGFIALDCELNEGVFFGLWPGCRVYRQHQELALRNDRCQRMQELRPRWPGRDLRKQYRVHRGRCPKRDREPKDCAQDHEQCGARREMPAFPEHPRHAALKGAMHSSFERLVAYLLPQPRPVSADRYAKVSATSLGKGNKTQRAAHDSNYDIAENPGRQERKKDDLHCQREGVVEKPHQDRKDESQDLVGGERDNNERDDNHIVEGTAEAAFPGPCRIMIIGHGATVPAEDSGSCRLKLADCTGHGASLTGHLTTIRRPPM